MMSDKISIYRDMLEVAIHEAELKQIPVDKIIEQCDNNALSLFNIKTKT